MDEDFATSDVTDRSLEKENELPENWDICSHNFDSENSN